MSVPPVESSAKKAREHTGPGSEIVLPEVVMHLVRPGEPVIGTIVKNEVCTRPKAASFVRHIDVDVSGTALAGAFRAGQSFGVIPPGVDAKGQPHKVRLYSIAAPTRGEDGKGQIISTTVKRTIDEHWDDHRLFLGVASNYLSDLHPGATVHVSGPNGKRFLIPANPEAHDYVFFATGTGIAPFRGMLLDLFEQRAKSRIALVMGAPYATDLLYDEFFRTMEQEHSNFRYIPALSRQAQEDGKPAMYVQKRISSERDSMLPLLGSDRTLVYICGIAGMELGILQELARVLPGEAREHYLHCDAETLANIDAWTGRMLHKQVKVTRRVFMEVY